MPRFLAAIVEKENDIKQILSNQNKMKYKRAICRQPSNADRKSYVICCSSRAIRLFCLFVCLFANLFFICLFAHLLACLFVCSFVCLDGCCRCGGGGGSDIRVL